MGTEFQLGQMNENVPEMEGADGCTTMWLFLTPLNWAYKNGQMVYFMLCACYPNFSKSQGRKNFNID